MLTPITEKLIKKFNKTNLSLEDRIALTNTILSTLSVLPIDDVIEIETNSVKIRGRKLSVEDTISFSESCKALKDNKARQVINDQIKFLALNFGINKSIKLEDLMFAKAAIWNLQQEEDLLNKII